MLCRNTIYTHARYTHVHHVPHTEHVGNSIDKFTYYLVECCRNLLTLFICYKCMLTVQQLPQWNAVSV